VRDVCSDAAQGSLQTIATSNDKVIGSDRRENPYQLQDWCKRTLQHEEEPMKIWNKPQVREQEVGLEVTSYLPAEIDIV